jgi:hypothetical protein
VALGATGVEIADFKMRIVLVNVFSHAHRN